MRGTDGEPSPKTKGPSQQERGIYICIYTQLRYRWQQHISRAQLELHVRMSTHNPSNRARSVLTHDRQIDY